MSAQLVKELRERTGAGITDCMKAIKEANGDIEKAVIWLQENGAAKAAKKAGAVAAEGVVAIVKNDSKVVIFEVNSQTDFVAANDQFKALVEKVGAALLANNFSSIDEANAVIVEGKTVAELCVEATVTIGEKIVLRRAESIILGANQVAGAYVHVNKRIAAVVVTEGGSEEVARNVAMHVASMNPQFLDEAAVPADKVAAFKAEIDASPALAGKPENIKANIAAGMLRKQLAELTLVDQEFVMEKMPVAKYLSQNSAVAKKMARLEVGEGIAKVESNFAEEVKAQMGGNQ